MKVKIPTFKGTHDPEVYLEWEMKVKQVFACYNYNEEKKIKLAPREFEGYALVWWNQVKKMRKRGRENMSKKDREREHRSERSDKDSTD